MANLGAGKSETRFVSATGIALLCVAAGALLLFLLPREDPRIAALRQFSYDVLTPVMDVLGRPFIMLRDAGRNVSNIGALQEDNTRLAEENAALREQIAELTRVRFLMQEYRNLLDLPPEPRFEMLPVRVVADMSSPFARTLVANGGRDRGIEAGFAVMGPNGVVGRVISSGARSSRILLLTDFSSNIPVVALASDVQGILAGRNDGPPQLQFLPRKAALKEGDLLVTSGRGGQIPVGLPVGLIAPLAEDKPPQVTLLDAGRDLLYVRIVKVETIETPPDETAIIGRRGEQKR